MENKTKKHYCVIVQELLYN